jgi:hypothetical protein
MVVRFSSLRACRTLLQRRFLVLISVAYCVESRAIVRLEGLGQLKNPTNSSRIDPAKYQASNSRNIRCHIPEIQGVTFQKYRASHSENIRSSIPEIAGVTFQKYLVSFQKYRGHIPKNIRSHIPYSHCSAYALLWEPHTQNCGIFPLNFDG